MSILMTLRIAFKALGRNKLRTALTMLGMIIGVAAVIAMVALGTGAQADDRGTGQDRRHEPHHDHAPAARTRAACARAPAATAASCRGRAGAPRLPEIEYVAESIGTRLQVIYGTRTGTRSVEGTNVDLPLIRSWPLKYGAFFTDEDVKAAAKVVVLGSNVSEHAVRRERGSDRRADSRPQPGLPRARRDVVQGRGRRRHQHGRPGLRRRTPRS